MNINIRGYMNPQTLIAAAGTVIPIIMLIIGIITGISNQTPEPGTRGSQEVVTTTQEPTPGHQPTPPAQNPPATDDKNLSEDELPKVEPEEVVEEPAPTVIETDPEDDGSQPQQEEPTVDPLPVEDSHPHRIEQGDAIYTLDSGRAKKCTLGYIDAVNRVGYTAGHCILKNGARISQVVSSKGGFDWYDFRVIGTIRVHDKYDYAGFTSRVDTYDIARIEFDDSVDLGGNIYSGDNTISKSDVTEGVKVCMFGDATKEVSCGEVVDFDGGDDFRSSIGAQGGDSGGPVWAIDDTGNSLGLIGFHSYTVSNTPGGASTGSGHTYTDLMF